MKAIHKVFAFVLAVTMTLSASVVAFADEDTKEARGKIASRYIRAIIQKIDEDYRFDADKDAMYNAVLDYVMKENPDLLEGAIRVVTDTLDEHSQYFSQEELETFVNIVEETYVGIGVTIVQTAGGVEIQEVDPKGSAFAAGVKVGDIIISVNGTDVVGKEVADITKLVRGEAGTSVTIGVRRGEETLEIPMVRKRIFAETVAYSIEEEDRIAYIYISKFAMSTPESVRLALEDIEKHGIRKLLIDVRDNPGGDLSAIIEVLSMFVPKNKVLTKIEYNDPRMTTELKSNAKFTKTPDREIVILANENSASAAELFAGAMQNLKLAKVVGVTTHGKGSMQSFLQLINPPGFQLGDIKISVAEFTKPDGSKINGIGIEPDVRVKNVIIPYDTSKLTPMTIADRYTTGSKAEDVRAIEERLSVLGYFPGDVDDTFDSLTAKATEKFQADTGLFPYGVMDYTTQNMLNDKIAELEVEEDRQFDKAYDVLLKK